MAEGPGDGLLTKHVGEALRPVAAIEGLVGHRTGDGIVVGRMIVIGHSQPAYGRLATGKSGRSA
jgi:hypothetical protein